MRGGKSPVSENSKGALGAGAADYVGRQSAEAMLKRERTRFSSVALPFPSCCQANTARSEGSICEETMFSVRFHTALAIFGPSRTMHKSTTNSLNAPAHV
ncbi:hypothetical protein Bcep1808_5851 [Burkholderia vietnamiensis G4]|uniref:Uncharacterized protein n=1 Tax=Burkholderia vietnamiensis (strain G4 / LMG 22486) TaxID=269482 RepID=A4JR78_BURVG|nr:hypothetical protein Bcep1808_5851 [Burkholderia vietnamiensis G4]